MSELLIITYQPIQRNFRSLLPNYRPISILIVLIKVTEPVKKYLISFDLFAFFHLTPLLLLVENVHVLMIKENDSQIESRYTVGFIEK